MKEAYRTIRRPVLSEKSDISREIDKYYFEVDMDANKMDIREAVESIFGVKVSRVNTEIVRGKSRRVGRIVGRKPSWKKACVTLKEGHSIDLFEGI